MGSHSQPSSQRFRSAILERLGAARDAGELDPNLGLTAAAVLLAASLDRERA
jgi:hypothetical protein